MRPTPRLTLALFAALLTAGLVPAQDIRINPSRDDDRGRSIKNNPRVLAAFRPALVKAALSTVRIHGDGRQVALGTVVHADGYVLTKATELKGTKLTVRDYDGREYDAERIAVHDAHDLAMLKVNATDLPAVAWSPSGAAPVGNWVASAAPGDDPVAVGVISVAARAVPPPRFPVLPPPSPNSGFLGVNMEPTEYGAKLTQVRSGSAAEKAGLKVSDVIVSVNSRPIASPEQAMSTLQTFKPGEVIRVVIHRADRIMEKSAKLDRRPPDANLGNRGEIQNRMGSELSEKRTGFPNILQHDTVIKPADCGGPLVDLDGRVVGINIARAGRVETFAIPSEVIVPLLSDLIAGKSVTAAAPQTPADKVKAAREALKLAEEDKGAADGKVAAARAALEKALAEEKAANEAKDDKPD